MLRVMTAFLALLLASHPAASAPISSEFGGFPVLSDPVAAIPADGRAGLPGALPRPYILILNDAAGDLRPWKYHPELSRVFELRFLALSARQPAYLISGSAGSRTPILPGLSGSSVTGLPATFRTLVIDRRANGSFLRIGDADGTESLGGTGVMPPDSARDPAPVPVPSGAAGLGLALGLAAVFGRFRAPSAGSSR